MTLSLRANLPVDDTDPDIFYSAGDWQEQTGSSRQFDSNVHLTNSYGATINFRYSGQAFVLFGTTPGGSNNIIFDVSIDGGSPTTVTKACESNEQFQVDLFESPVVDFDVHSVIITNRGRSTDASFMFDNLVLYSNDINPSMTSRAMPTTTTSTTPRVVPPSVATHNLNPPSTQVSQSSTSSTTSSTTTTSASSSSQTPTESESVSNSSTFTTSTSESTTTFLTTDSRGNTVIFTQTFTTSFLASSQTGNVAAIGNPSHIGTVMAGVFGGLAFLLLVVVVVLVVRRRRKNSRAVVEEDARGLVLKKSRSGKPSMIPQPFRLSTPRDPISPDTSPTSGHSPSNLMSEKLGRRKNSTRSPNRDNSPEPESSTAGPSSGNQVSSHAPLTQTHNRGFSTAAQPDSATNILSHRRSASMANAADRETAPRPHSPTMSSMYMSSVSGETYDAPPAYQPPLTGVRTSEFKTRSQLYNDHTSRPPGEDE